MYLLKVNICIAIFYVVYLVLFRQTNRLQLNRAFLLLGLLMSFLVPLVVLTSNPINLPVAILAGDTIMDNLTSAETIKPLDSRYSFFSYIYYCGVLVSVFVTIISCLKVFRIYLSAQKLKRDHHTVFIHPNIQPFSFFGMLFIRSRDEDPMIVEHEMAHIKQRHWVDLVLVELASIFLWFNPIIHFYRQSILLQHEYIADRHVATKVSVESYLDCVAKHLESTIDSKLANSFNTHSIKKRIVMITETKNHSAIRYLVILPLVAIVIMAFATRRTTSNTVMQDIQLTFPVDANKVKQGDGAGYGKRINPKTNSEVFHTGLDLILSVGNNVYAAADGVVISAENAGDYGKLVIIKHSKDLQTSSAHLESILVKAGDKVEAGHIIGTVGSTGLSSGPHLHFEVLKDGKTVDPAAYLNK